MEVTKTADNEFNLIMTILQWYECKILLHLAFIFDNFSIMKKGDKMYG